ncbi:MAG: ATP-dependent helicase HrpA [Oligoflexales bacterium]|nr:ATP-dependent helicase HrpA [Oligoflexales bacterium]
MEKKSTYISWQELLRRTFEIDLTICKFCGGRLRVIAAIIKKDVAYKILDHLGLPTTAPPTPPKTTTYIDELFPLFGFMQSQTKKG